jgi:hypothetical protein
LVNSKGIQFVASILKDKLPEELNREEYIVVKLSQGDKLFRIENWFEYKLCIRKTPSTNATDK